MMEVEATSLQFAGKEDKVTITYDIPLTMKEIEVVRFIVDRYRKALIFELANTDSRDLKQYLKEREDMLQGVVQRFDAFSGEPDETEPVD